MAISATLFNSAGQRRLHNLTLPDGATVRHALAQCGETVPSNCEVYIDGVAATEETQLAPGAGLRNITINQKTKGN
jgi:hypothetical protein